MLVGLSLTIPSAAQNSPYPQRIHCNLRAGVLVTRTVRSWADGRRAVLSVAALDLCAGRYALTLSTPQRGRRTLSQGAQGHNVLVAINGDYFSLSTRLPEGPARAQGTLWPTAPLTHHDALVQLTADGVVRIHPVQASGIPALRAAFASVTAQPGDVFSARELVLDEGQPRLSPHIAHDGQRHPRTALGVSRDGRLAWLVVIDGRTQTSAGATVEELSAVMQSLGAWRAVKLDGGGSSEMFARGLGVINHPSDGHERIVSQHVMVRGTRVGSPAICR